MSQVKAEVALNLLKYFRWLVQSYKTILVSFYIAQKQRVKDSGWLSISGNDSSCKQISDERHSRGSQEQTYSSESVI